VEEIHNEAEEGLCSDHSAEKRKHYKEDSPEEEDKQHNPLPSSFAPDVVLEDCVRSPWHLTELLHLPAVAEGLLHLPLLRCLDLLMAL
jgi:hypothetical protein